MAYSVTFYFGTACNLINSPDTPAKLASFASSTLTVSNCDILRIRGLTHFTVQATYESLKGADYCSATNGTDTAYFSITGDIEPTSEDVCVVPVHIDPWLTAGGTATTAFLDGLTERHHIAKSEDTFGAYTEDDPYMAPSHPLKIVSASSLFFSGTASDHQLIEASLKIGTMGDSSSINALTYTDANTGKTATVPRTVPLDSTDRTAITMNIPNSSSTTTGTPVTQYYDATNSQAMAGLAKVRDLGAEGSILNSWSVPNVFWSADSTNSTTGAISSISSASQIVDSGLNYQYASVKNQRVLSGMDNKYFIQSVASGNVGEFSPESIYHSGDSSPNVAMCADVRPNGKPYFRFEYYMNNTEFFMNCVPGLEWQNAPLVYYAKSGNEKDSFTFTSEHNYARDIYNTNARNAAQQQSITDQMAMINGQAQLMQSGIQAPVGFSTGDISMGVQGVTGIISNGVLSALSQGAQRASYDANAQAAYNAYNLAAAKERAQFNLSQSVVEPTIQFPRSEGLRDFLGNGCRVYRLRYSDADVVKIDNTLEAYGYKDTTLISPTHFTNRSKFNYVKASGISIKNDNIPMWLRDELAAQLSAGIRIWHVRPDASAYTDGTNT